MTLMKIKQRKEKGTKKKSLDRTVKSKTMLCEQQQGSAAYNNANEWRPLKGVKLLLCTYNLIKNYIFHDLFRNIFNLVQYILPPTMQMSKGK